MQSASGTSWDPIRPIKSRDEFLNPNDCVHPWARIALVQTDNGNTKLQCYDCKEFMFVNGYPLIFEFAKE